MKRIVLILNLIMSLQLFAEEEKEVDFSKYVQLINSDVLFSKNVQMIKDFFEYEVGNCDNVFRITVTVKAPNGEIFGLTDEELAANLLIQYKNKIKTKFDNDFNKKYPGFEHIGPCTIKNLMANLYEIKDRFNKKSWKVLHEIGYNLDYVENPKTIQQTVRWPFMENGKQSIGKPSPIDSYAGRKSHSKMICAQTSRLFSVSEAIKICKADLGIVDEPSSFVNVK